jgi:hypothetical protein
MRSFASSFSDEMRERNLYALDSIFIVTISALKVYMKCNQLHAFPPKVGNSVTGNLVCELPEYCERVKLLLCSELPGELSYSLWAEYSRWMQEFV